MLAKTTIVRALKTLRDVRSYLGSKLARVQISEQTLDGTGGDVLADYQSYDHKVANKTLQTTAGRAEQTAEFCLARDFRNSRRSRRYIWARAYQAKMRNAISEVVEFAGHNSDLNLEKIASINPDTLLAKDLQALQEEFKL